MTEPPNKTLVLLRHGQITWNAENRFTGWTDVGLSELGHVEAVEAGRRLLHDGLQFDIAFTSVLKRAIKTVWLALEEMDQMWIPVHRSWRLNERHYGSLQGQFKHEVAKKVGEEQVQRWRRSFDVRPPALSEGDKRFPGNDRRYASLDPAQLPCGESLKDTIERALPYWHETIVPAFASADSILIVAHGNTLRALIKYLKGLTDEKVVGLEVPTGEPVVYRFDHELRLQQLPTFAHSMSRCAHGCSPRSRFRDFFSLASHLRSHCSSISFQQRLTKKR
ncbi:2,3-bisphosphoglycerate-dependent phosphoglycerate mutase [Novipirellula galeiformis]|uniref:2,3-bisphosphoglycerate-dependent phosphoglycerate mutase n=1 Tax=Novipirellula galeiformis TaxID=2528004 RepID=A0A5C6CDD9_9BACT|nr:2,3-diphosphoglycerate-dependent phosphoglycerate mutase [Novipirellula galeiformis]TWU21441.1 2,3-bisphosphoglycerate-dependent phosphoglycerate mutase [Novipirellula galeiformis]